jgi:hypothetical protein
VRKHKISYIIILGFLIFYIVQSIIEDKRSSCELLNLFRSYDFNGIIIKKFKDSSDHAIKKVIIKNFNQENLDTIDLFEWDETGTYFKIQERDTILKKEGTDSIYLSNKNGRSAYVPNFGCAKK